MENDVLNERRILSVFDDSEGRYKVTLCEKTSVSEVAFAIAVIAKCLDRDGVIEQEEFMNLVNKYLTDSQYKEIQS